MNVQGFVDHSQMKPSVVLTGTAKEGSNAPPVGLVDIGTSEGAYLFRVALPGVRKDQCKFPSFSFIMQSFCHACETSKSLLMKIIFFMCQ